MQATLIMTTLALTGGLLGSGLVQWLPPPLEPRAVRPLEPQLPAGHTAPPELSGHLFMPAAPATPATPTVGTDAPCEIPWRLVGTMLDRDVPARSFAAVHTPEGASLIARSMTISEITVVELTAESATLERADGRRCELHMFTRDERTVTTTIAATVTESTAPTVRRISPNHIEIDRGLLRPSGELQHVRVIPDLRAGRMAGFRIFGVRPGSALAAAGVQSGDSIRAVDGRTITGPDIGLEAVARLRSGAPVRVTIARGGVEHETTVSLAP